MPIVSVEQPGWVQERSSEPPGMALTVPCRRGGKRRSAKFDVGEPRVRLGQPGIEPFESVEQDLGDCKVP